MSSTARRSNLGAVSEVILGQILIAGQGMNPARQASINAGIPFESPAWIVNQMCGSGLRAIVLGAQAIASGDSAIVIAGGQESMSQAPHAAYMRSGKKMGDVEFVDTMIRDGLWDVFNGYHMGTTAENVARQWQITREEQDAFALASQQKASAARKSGRFKDEIVPVTVKTRKGETTIDTDEYIRDDATLESLQSLRPAFDREGTVTAGNASGVNDGAAAAVLMAASEAERRGLSPLARIVSYPPARCSSSSSARSITRFFRMSHAWSIFSAARRLSMMRASAASRIPSPIAAMRSTRQRVKPRGKRCGLLL